MSDQSPLPRSAADPTDMVTADVWRQALEANPLPVYITDRDHQLVFVNAACAKVLERSPQTLMGTREADWLVPVGESLQPTDAASRPSPSLQSSAPLTLSCETISIQGRAFRRHVQPVTDGSGWICSLEPLPGASVDKRSPTAPPSSPWTLPQLQALLANVPAVIYQLCRHPDRSLQFAFISPGTDELFGFSAEASPVDLEHILRHVHPLDRDGFEQSLAASAEALTPWRWEGRYYKPDGQLGWLQTAACVHRLASGTVMWDGLLMDITSRKKVEAASIEQAVMEQALADNETRFRTISATIPGALIQLREERGRLSVDFVSDRIQAITGLTATSIIADAEVLLERIHPMDSERLHETVRQAIAQVTPWQFEGRIVTPSGQTRWWRLDAQPLSQLGKAISFCGVVLDITERKAIEDAYRENERQLRLALRVSGMGVWTWDMATDEMHWTTEPGTLFAETAVSFCDTFASYLQNVHPSDREIVQASISRALETGDDYQIEYRLRLSNDDICWVGERVGLWRDPDGMMLGLMGTVVDITHRKMAEAALRESEERTRTLINNIPGAVYRCKADQKWTPVFQSEALAEITGYPVDHPIHLEEWRLLHPHDRERVDVDIAAAIAQQQPFEVEYRLLHADGTIRWVLETGQPLADATGTIQFIDGVLTDITRRKESEKRLERLARREGLVNRISTKIRDSLELMPILQTTVQAVRSQLATDRVVVYRFQPDWTGEVIVEDVDPQWPSTLGEIGSDNCFPNGLAEHYQDGRTRAINDIYQAGLDDCHVQYLENLHVKANLIVPILLKQRLWGLLIAHECNAPREWTDGERELLVALAGQVGLAIGQADLYRQATQNAAQAREKAANLKTALAELKSTQAQLVQTEKMSSLGQLVAGVAHEINNPVSFIDGNVVHASEYAQDLLALMKQFQTTYPNPPEELAQFIEEIDLDFLMSDFPRLLDSMRVGAKRIKSIVNSLRTFSRMDEAEIKAVNIHDGIDSTLMILQHRLKANGDRPAIDILRNYGELPQVECYAGQLNQVFMNLLSNAIDALEEHLATGPRSAPPTITIATQSDEGDRVRITIADNGSGIPADKRQRIFEPFYTTKPIGKGTGIGLSISYQIVTERHLGTLVCESQPDAGTTFHITIPIHLGTT